MKYNKGDKVRVISDNGAYPAYLNWLAKNSVPIGKELSYWLYNREMDESGLNDEWTVIHSSPHHNSVHQQWRHDTWELLGFKRRFGSWTFSSNL